MTHGPAPICLFCKRFNHNIINKNICDAFADGIPENILLNKVDHRKEVSGDGGLLFDPINDGALLYAEQMFAPSEE